MQEAAVKALIKSVIGAVVGAVLGGGGVYIELSRELSKVSETLGEVKNELGRERAKSSQLERKHGQTLQTLGRLREDHSKLKKEYEKATNKGGVIIDASLAYGSERRGNIKVGGGLTFGVWGSDGDMSIKVRKVTAEGIEVKVENCGFYQVGRENAQKTGADNSYFLTLGAPFVIEATSECCMATEGMCDLQNAERLFVTPERTNMNDYSVAVRYTKASFKTR